MSKNKLSLRIELDGEYIDLFEKVKEDYSFKSNTDVVRFCIKETAGSIDFELDESLKQIISNYLNNDNVKIKYSIFSIRDFVKKSIENLLEDISKNLESIKSWDIRSHLSPEEAEIALALIEAQSESEANQATVEDIGKKLGSSNTKRIEVVLDDFVERGILSSAPSGGQKYYHAR